MTLGCSLRKIIRKEKVGVLRYRDLNSEIPISISSFAHIEIGHRSRNVGEKCHGHEVGAPSLVQAGS